MESAIDEKTIQLIREMDKRGATAKEIERVIGLMNFFGADSKGYTQVDAEDAIDSYAATSRGRRRAPRDMQPQEDLLTQLDRVVGSAPRRDCRSTVERATDRLNQRDSFYDRVSQHGLFPVLAEAPQRAEEVYPVASAQFVLAFAVDASGDATALYAQHTAF